MSFSAKTKNELSRVISPKKCCNVAELSALVKLSGSLQLAGNKKINLKITTEHNSIARKIFKLLKLNFGINTKISVNKNKTLKKSTSYVLLVTSDMGAINLLKDLGILYSEEDFYTINTVPHSLVKHEDCARSFIRGAFLGGGSISDPEKNYHLEFVTSNEEFAESLKDLINSIGFNSKIVPRKNNYVVYLKESEQISDLLSIIGAHNALLSLQNVKIVKEMRNNVNRIVNCETANLSKTVSAAVRQIDNIKYIRDAKGLEYIPRNLREIANLRIEYEDLTLKELGEMLNPPVGKSGVNHRLRKIEQIAEDLREKNGHI